MKALLSFLVALGIPAAFWNFYFKEAPDVRYSVSTAISLTSQGNQKEGSSDGEFVQQIEVANTGKAEAKNVIVKIPSLVSQYNLVKHYSGESVQVLNSNSIFELNYPSLPPSARFQLTLRMKLAPIADDAVTVSHQNGKGVLVSPGARAGDFSIWTMLSVIAPFVYICLSYFEVRGSLRHRFIFRRYLFDFNRVIKEKKPWYIPQDKWPELLGDLIRRAVSEPIKPYEPLVGSPAYVFLSSERHKDILPTDWDKLCGIATSNFSGAVIFRARSAQSSSEIADLLNIKWPSAMSEAKKDELTVELSRIYCDMLLASPDSSVLLKLLADSSKPIFLFGIDWDWFKQRAEKKIGGKVAEKVIDAEGVLDVDGLPEWGVLSISERRRLDKLTKLKKELSHLEEKSEELDQLSSKLNKKEYELALRAAEVADSELKAKSNFEKVKRQLDTIEKVFVNPSSIDRIEPNDDTFVPANWLLLKGVAIKLSAVPKTLTPNPE